MPLSDEDYQELLRHLQKHLRRAEPEMFERLAERIDFEGTQRQRVIRYLHNLIGMMKERSSGSFSNILDLLNRNISTEDGKPIDQIRVVLTPEEQQLYQIDEIDLSELPDRTKLIMDLQKILDSLEQSDG